jgi:hypothetical protein
MPCRRGLLSGYNAQASTYETMGNLATKWVLNPRPGQPLPSHQRDTPSREDVPGT